jgi:hypothetical protein
MIPRLINIDWVVCTAIELILVIVLFKNGKHRVYPFFTSYLCVVVLHTLIVFEAYRTWGYSSKISFVTVWSSQTIVLVVRIFALVELCRKILRGYTGIWTFARHIIAATAAIVLVYAILLSGRDWILLAANLQRAVELSIAVGLFVFFLFVYYYRVHLNSEIRSLGIGFFLLSACWVINASILEYGRQSYIPVWNLCSGLIFLTNLGIWMWALRLPQMHWESKPVLLPQHIYGQMAPEINIQLRMLNEKLSRFRNAETGKT